jgi:hypothetical protein
MEDQEGFWEQTSQNIIYQNRIYEANDTNQHSFYQDKVEKEVKIVCFEEEK